MIRLVVLFALLPLMVIACSPVQPFESAQTVGFAGDQEKRLWKVSEQFDQELAFSDLLYADPRLQGYLQKIIERLYPEFQKTLRVHILKSPSLNAFVLPNGSIYIHTGLLARFANEAQAATVLGHECAHFVARHSLQQTQRSKFSTALARSISLTGIPLVGSVLAASSISGYSQALENAADEVAFQRLLQAGYSSLEAVKVFRRIAAETEARRISEPFFFSTHPQMQERVRSFQRMHQLQGQNGTSGEGTYLELTNELRLLALAEDLAMGHYKSVLLALKSEPTAELYPAYSSYYLGEAYRQRGEPGDQQLALASYQQAILRAPGYAPSYRALGYHHFKLRQDQQAQNYLEKYLALAPQAADRDYVLLYLAQIKERE